MTKKLVRDNSWLRGLNGTDADNLRAETKWVDHVTEDSHHLGSFILRSFNIVTSQHPNPPIIIPRLLFKYAIN